MLGSTVYSPWLLAATLALSPVLVHAAQDPIADSAEQEVSAPEATESGSTTTNDFSSAAGAPQTADAAAGGVDSFAETAADEDGGADPFGEAGAGSGEQSSDLEDEYGFDPAGEFASEEEPADRDPWEGFNRAVFRFNDTADRWILKPVATSYRQVTPIFMQTGISNFFSNLREVPSTLNSVLQWKWGQAGNNTGRFLINSTVGLVGLFDVAEHFGLEQSDGEDFGQTLAVWGVPSGPYLVLPIFGPSSVRGAPGRVVDIYTYPLIYIDHDPTYYAFGFTDLMQTRASLLKAEALVQGDRYVLFRDAYLQRREYLINDGELEDDFGGELDDYDF